MNHRKQLIENSQKLEYESKIELFHYITNTFNLNFMENINGIFFSLNEINDNNVLDILQKTNDLMEMESERSIFPRHKHADTETADYNTDIQDDDLKSDLMSKKSFDLDKTMIKDIDNHINKTNKKSIHVKYSIAKKKYNKQIQIDSKKIENNDLSELTEETYIY